MYKASIFIVLLALSSLGWAQEPAAPPADTPPQAQGEMGRGMRRGPGVAGTITAINDGSITVRTRDA